MNRWALPAFSGIRPTSGTSPTPRRVSSIAKRSRVPNASRGVVATQLGLPRPAFNIGSWLSFSVSEASSMSLSFSSNGLSFRSARCSARDVDGFFVLVGMLRSPSDLVSISCASARPTSVGVLADRRHDSSMTMTIPQIVSSVLPMA